LTKTPSGARGPSPMAPKGWPGCRRHRRASVGEPPRGVDGIRRPKIACRRQGGGGLQHPEEPSLGHSLPVKAGTDGSLPPIIRADAPLHPARGPSVPATPYATDRAGCYDVLILQPEAESPDRSAPNAAAVWLLRSEEHTSELQSLMRISYAVFCLKKKKKTSN